MKETAKEQLSLLSALLHFEKVHSIRLMKGEGYNRVWAVIEWRGPIMESKPTKCEAPTMGGLIHSIYHEVLYHSPKPIEGKA